jgi:hypothetical protein
MFAKPCTEDERLVAEQALAMYREVKRAKEAAPHGQGLACTESALLEHGRAFLRSVLEQTVSAHAEAQKGGPAVGRVSVEEMPHSSITPPKY